MPIQSDSDNIYKVGTVTYAKCDPKRLLLIDSYKQRIYFCKVVGQPAHKLLAYFEAELVSPGI